MKVLLVITDPINFNYIFYVLNDIIIFDMMTLLYAKTYTRMWIESALILERRKDG